MAFPTKMKIKPAEGEHDALCLIKHPMETGNRVDQKTGKKVPAHFIQGMHFNVNGNEVAFANLSQGISKNPLIGVRITGAKTGDKVAVSWEDNLGNKGTAEATVK